VLLEAQQSMQVGAGRLRTLVRGTWRLLSERVSLCSRQETAIDGRRILLG